MKRQTSGVAAVTPASGEMDRNDRKWSNEKQKGPLLPAPDHRFNGQRPSSQDFNTQATPMKLTDLSNVPSSAYSFAKRNLPLLTCPPPSQRIGEGPLIHNVPFFTEYGVYMTIPDFRIDVSLSGAIRVYSMEYKSVAAVSISSGSVAIVHPQARLLLEDGVLEISSQERLAKISSDGMSFKRIKQGLCYRLDASGCKTSTDKYHRLDTEDYTSQVLYKNMARGTKSKEKILMAYEKRTHFTNRQDEDIWMLADHKLTAKTNGELTITRYPHKMFMSFGPDGTVKVKLDNYRMSVGYTHLNTGQSNGTENHRENCIKMRDGKLVANYGHQEAGLDKYGQLFVK